MIKLRLLKTSNVQQVKLDRQDLTRIAAYAMQLIRKRCALAMDIKEKSAKPLSKSYAARKKKLGQPPVRNLMFSGAMLGAMTVTQTTDDSITIGWTRRAELIKATKNQQRSPWFPLSKHEEDAVITFASKLLKDKAKKLSQ